ncbi:MAG: fibronectin type III domain-containing protein [Lachnospiraceae bacterium]|nr:fibronectin type III domain-containing protein [Lachnospiraceae bacterium]
MSIKGFMKKISMIGMVAFMGISMSTPVLAVTPSYHVHPYSFSIDQSEVSVKEGETFALKAGGSAATLGTTSWKTSDDSIVKICSTESGSFGFYNGYRVKLQALKTGTAVITAINTKNSNALTCKVIVEKEETDEPEMTNPDMCLETPVILSVTNSGTSKAGGISVSWKAVDGASQYQVQVSPKKDFSTTKIDKMTNKTSYSAAWNYYNNVGSGTKNPTYYYRVKAIADDDTESAWSDVVSCPVS